MLSQLAMLPAILWSVSVPVLASYMSTFITGASSCDMKQEDRVEQWPCTVSPVAFVSFWLVGVAIDNTKHLYFIGANPPHPPPISAAMTSPVNHPYRIRVVWRHDHHFCHVAPAPFHLKSCCLFKPSSLNLGSIFFRNGLLKCFLPLLSLSG